MSTVAEETKYILHKFSFDGEETYVWTKYLRVYLFVQSPHVPSSIKPSYLSNPLFSNMHWRINLQRMSHFRVTVIPLFEIVSYTCKRYNYTKASRSFPRHLQWRESAERNLLTGAAIHFLFKRFKRRIMMSLFTIHI